MEKRNIERRECKHNKKLTEEIKKERKNRKCWEE
jgi:hypothetical protein